MNEIPIAVAYAEVVTEQATMSDVVLCSLLLSVTLASVSRVVIVVTGIPVRLVMLS